MSREFLGDSLHVGKLGKTLPQVEIDPSYVSCIDKAPTLESHQTRRNEQDAATEQRRLELVAQETSERVNNEAVEIIQRYAAELEPFGTRTMPPPWYKRLYWRWAYKFKEIVKIIKE